MPCHHILFSLQHWSGAILPQGPWLQPRAYHSAHSLWDPDSNPEDPCLVVACGVACDGRVLDDVWILSVNSLTSVQVSMQILCADCVEGRFRVGVVVLRFCHRNGSH